MDFKESKGKGTDSNQFIYSSAAEKFVPVLENSSPKYKNELLQRSKEWMQDAFLPQGYPHTVSDDYLQYQIWDSLQAYCSSIAGALSLRATLEGLGVGQDNANPLAATLIWLMKDGSGMVSSILFAYWKGTQLDCNNKQWRLFADFFCDLANLTKLLAPILPIPFLLTISISSVMNSLVGVAGGATKAAVSVHQARNSNISDISAKESSQETVVNLAALITSLTLLHLFTATTFSTWFTFLMFMFLHLWCNYKAMRSLKMETLNRPRLLYILESWIKNRILPGIEETNLNEPLFLGAAFKTDYLIPGYSLKLGYSYHTALNQTGQHNKSIKELHDRFTLQNKGNKFILINNSTENVLYGVFKEGLSNEDQLLAVWTALLFALNKNKNHLNLKDEFRSNNTNTHEGVLPDDIIQKAKSTFPKLLASINEKGWLLHPLQIGADEWRLQI